MPRWRGPARDEQERAQHEDRACAAGCEASHVAVGGLPAAGQRRPLQCAGPRGRDSHLGTVSVEVGVGVGTIRRRPRPAVPTDWRSASAVALGIRSDEERVAEVEIARRVGEVLRRDARRRPGRPGGSSGIRPPPLALKPATSSLPSGLHGCALPSLHAVELQRHPLGQRAEDRRLALRDVEGDVERDRRCARCRSAASTTVKAKSTGSGTLGVLRRGEVEQERQCRHHRRRRG